MNAILAALSKVPPPVAEAVIGLVGAVFNLITAETDSQREEALMEAAEVTKRALDAQKFGG